MTQNSTAGISARLELNANDEMLVTSKWPHLAANGWPQAAANLHRVHLGVLNYLQITKGRNFVSLRYITYFVQSDVSRHKYPVWAQLFQTFRNTSSRDVKKLINKPAIQPTATPRHGCACASSHMVIETANAP